jgi:hypothetical protein
MQFWLVRATIAGLWIFARLESAGAFASWAKTSYEVECRQKKTLISHGKFPLQMMTHMDAFLWVRAVRNMA